MTLALTMTILITTQTWNPLPQVTAQLESWWGRFTALSEPLPLWTVRAGGSPDIAAVMRGGEVVVGTRGFVTAYDPQAGRTKWERKVHWALPADDVVIVRLRPENPDADPDPDTGFSVIEPATGAVLWSDREAQAVWAFADAVVDLTCTRSGDCQLRARTHRLDGALLWSLTMPPAARSIRGANPALAGTRDPAEWFAPAAAGTPGPMPPVLGLTVDGRIHVVDSFRGAYIREVTPPDRQTRVAVTNDRLLYIHAQPASPGCTYWVEAFDYLTNEPQWREEGYSLDTASGAGCEQRRDPLGRGGQLVVSGSDNRPRLVRAAQADDKWVGVPGEQILATDGELAVVQGADQQTLNLIDVERPDKATIWTTTTGLGAQAAITAGQVIVRDGDKGLLLVVSRTGTVIRLELETKADVIGYGAQGVILASGRKIGYYSFAR